jgi:phenylacetate-CoA ligase
MVKLRGVNVWPEACGDIAKNDKRVSNEYFCVADRINDRDQMTLMIELKEPKSTTLEKDVKESVTEMLRTKLSVSINVEIYNPGELQELTKFGIESKPRRFEDRRKK